MKDRTAISLKKDIEYINEKYGDHPAFYKYNNKPLYYVYDSYLIKDYEWAKVFKKNGESSIRGTKNDCIVISLYLGTQYDDFIIKSGFDGIYTYFASIGFTYGSTPSNSFNKF
jgi:glycoprotein endo-alpha-1,2-mannosidase